MANTLENGTKVFINSTESQHHRGWGIVKGFDGQHYDVAMYGGEECQPIFARDELLTASEDQARVKRNRVQRERNSTLRGLGLKKTPYGWE